MTTRFALQLLHGALARFARCCARPWSASLLPLLLCGLAFAASPVRADALDGVLEVQSAFVSIDDGVYQLHARVRYPANDETVAALLDGVSVSYDLDVEVTRARRYWFDAAITTVSLQRELTYHTVSERYVVRDAQGGEQSSFATLDAALEFLGAVEGWPILVASQVPEEGDYQVRVRASVHRGRLTDALRAIVFWDDGWNRQSEWYSWSLPR